LYFYLIFIWMIGGLVSCANIVQLIWGKFKEKKISKIIFIVPIFFLFTTFDIMICKYRSVLTEQNLLILDKVIGKREISDEIDLNEVMRKNSVLCRLLCYPISYHMEADEIEFTIRPLGPKVNFNYKNHSLNYTE
ncbi:hypothetical protein ACE5IS_19970, partial [Leptospira wolffii]|uniref:hypothetical protein n=1 Tax=Leptospira wolffii TaxID=409998 RepID=UPI0035CD2256